MNSSRRGGAPSFVATQRKAVVGFFITSVPLSATPCFFLSLHGSRGACGDVGHVAPVVGNSSLQILLSALKILLSLVQLLVLTSQELLYTLLWGQEESLPNGTVERCFGFVGLNLLGGDESGTDISLAH
jgi:hypothetical protein